MIAAASTLGEAALIILSFLAGWYLRKAYSKFKAM
jgi:hypothetical protein